VRVVIVSMAAGAVASYVRLLGELGHETAGVLTMRNRRRPEATAQIVTDVPAGIDVVVAGSADRMAPLLRSYDADVAVRRWQAFTGRDAIHSEAGCTFEQMSDRRRPPQNRRRGA